MAEGRAIGDLPSPVRLLRIGESYPAAIALQRESAVRQFDDLDLAGVFFRRGRMPRAKTNEAEPSWNSDEARKLFG